MTTTNTASLHDQSQEERDRRFMAAAIRYSRRHLGLTGTNPSVATLIVSDESGEPAIVGRGVTAIGGRPHAEAEALAEAGERARGATAYVTLEPCAHHGRTPPCAEALVAAGIKRVVGATGDPDERVAGRGYAILREAGIEVVSGVLAEEAADVMKGYLIRSEKKRAQVILKLALSADGMIGRQGRGQVMITGEIAGRQVHMMRAEADAILIGNRTALNDDPALTCRLPGLQDRSPARIVLDRNLRLPLNSTLVSSARKVPLFLTTAADCPADRRAAYAEAGVQFLAVETAEGEVALPELVEDLAARGLSTLFVEGGAHTANAFLEDDLVDKLCLFVSPRDLGAESVPAPIAPDKLPDGFRLVRKERFGEDDYFEYVRER
jgi:diaminohydroxyphosphoribosylaminopyrimidine deaminase/5-amino-6-(5-phosphoribosylamino)uracil reductase